MKKALPILSTFAVTLLAVAGCGSDKPQEEGVALSQQPATVPVLCQAMEKVRTEEDCVGSMDYATCEQTFGAAQAGGDCVGEVSALLFCVDMDVNFACDYTGIPYPRGEVTDAQVLDEYCEEEWFTALDCIEMQAAGG